MSIPLLRDRLVLLHHFSELFCSTVAMFNLGPDGYFAQSTKPTYIGLSDLTFDRGELTKDDSTATVCSGSSEPSHHLQMKLQGHPSSAGGGLDKLRGCLVSSVKVNHAKRLWISFKLNGKFL